YCTNSISSPKLATSGYNPASFLKLKSSPRPNAEKVSSLPAPVLPLPADGGWASVGIGSTD
ncbi:MAG: hypothetical protein AAB401_21310, partial [Acidobacteriota bacterium]